MDDEYTVGALCDSIASQGKKNKTIKGNISNNSSTEQTKRKSVHLKFIGILPYLYIYS
jgi:hypothetical protein